VNEEWHCSTFLSISLMSGLTEDDYIYASAFNLGCLFVETISHNVAQAGFEFMNLSDPLA
jgi:hypothetical protein